MGIIKNIQEFFSFWYLRYLLATELYMVEPWEKATIHVLMAILFVLFWYFNHSLVLNAVSQFRSPSTINFTEELL